MLKFEGLADVGDFIRAYDFKPMIGRPDCFVEGAVSGIQGHRGWVEYVIVCTKDSMADGKWSRVGETVFVPMEVSECSEWDNRIMKI